MSARRDRRRHSAVGATAFLICDLDGVLVDSGDAVERAWRWWAGEHGLSWADVEPGIHGMPSRDNVARLLPQADAFAESRRIEHYQATDLDGVVAIPAVLVTADRLTRGKPDPEGYLLAARELGAAPADCVVLEDAPAGIEAGRAAGMHVVGITTTHEPKDLDAHELAPSIAAWLASRNGAPG